MKKILTILAALLFSATLISAEMVIVGVNPTPKTSTTSSEASENCFVNTNLRADLIAGQVLSIKVVDSSANATFNYATWYSYPINTEDVRSATGFIEIVVLNDTSTTDPGIFHQYGDSVFAYYSIRTGPIPYDTAHSFLLADSVDITAVSGTAAGLNLTLVAATASFDTLFKAWTWFEITLADTTRWGQLYSQYFRITGTGDSATTIAGTYNTLGVTDRYKYWIVDPGTDDDSIGWSHANADWENTGTTDTADITASAQNLDSGMTINFDAGTGMTDKDTFGFVVSDSLHYGKTTDFTVRMGLNLKRER